MKIDLRSEFRSLAARTVVRLRRLEIQPEQKDDEQTAFITWPPARDMREYNSLAIRVGWLLPAYGNGKVWITCGTSLEPDGEPQPGPLTLSPVSDSREILRILTRSPIVLLARAMDKRNVRLAGLIRRAFVIDPDAHGDLEAVEWRRLYEAFGAQQCEQALMQDSERNFESLMNHCGARQVEVNVCGTGPSLSRIMDHPTAGAINIVCNSAVQCGELMEHLRPAVIAFLSPPLFSPSANARSFMSAVARCVERYGSYIVTRAGYRHHLLVRNYPDLRSRVIGLAPAPGALHPACGRMLSYSTNNVSTGLMLPMAAAFNPARIRVWGCDGRQPSDVNGWKYALTAPEPAPGADLHSAYTHSLNHSRASAAEYEKHCRCMETIVRYIEALGIEIHSATDSMIPVLASRSNRPDAVQSSPHK